MRAPGVCQGKAGLMAVETLRVLEGPCGLLNDPHGCLVTAPGRAGGSGSLSVSLNGHCDMQPLGTGSIMVVG